MTPDIQDAVQRYLRTGEADGLDSIWPGRDIIERERCAHDTLLGALTRAVSDHAGGATPPELPHANTRNLTRRKVEPMVRGLFPRAEQAAVLDMLERSVVFLTPNNIEDIILGCTWLSSAWDLANLYLGSVGAELLGIDAPRLVGLSEETTCYVSMAYFDEDDPFADFLVHEAAHVFHNCKRRTVGLAETRTRCWLLDIDFVKRETFAYACEAHARIVDRARNVKERLSLAERYAQEGAISDERVDPDEVADIVRDAAARRNGWKVILRRCAPPKRSLASPLSHLAR